MNTPTNMLEARNIPVELIHRNPAMDREAVTEFSTDDELFKSIKENGILQPLVVSERDGGGANLIDGYRRHARSLLLGYNELPCIVLPRLDEADMWRARFELHETHKSLTMPELLGMMAKLKGLA